MITPQTGPVVQTFGCRLNIAESMVMRGHAAAAGLHDAIIIHTCAVTAEAERQARQAIRKASRERPDRPIIVAGCAATLRPALFASMPGVVRVLDNTKKLDAGSWHGIAPPSAPSASEPSRALHTRGFVPVQQGCDHRCTFCIIPAARGDNRSVPAVDVVAKVRDLVESGMHEIVLTGVDVTAWGGDLPGTPALGDLVEIILAEVPDLPRLRLSSLDPAEIDERLWRVIERESRLMPHLHLSVQAGDDLVLKQMKRRHARGQVLEVAARARAARPAMAFGADIIAGFPTETEAQFRRSLDLVEEAGLDYVHVFPFSPREGTPAARLTPWPGPVVADRARRLRELGAERLKQRLAGLVGQEAAILVERDGTGHTPCFAKVRPTEPLAPGQIRTLRLTQSDGKILEGVPV
jgi:threonylcarbamoyladenosine tRNA methylthiotransferase MtaB